MRKGFLQRCSAAAFLAAVVVVFAVAAFPANAQDRLVPACTYTVPASPGPDGVPGTADDIAGYVIEGLCQFCDLFTLAHNVFNFFTLLVTPALAVVLFLIGAFFLMFSGGSEAGRTKGKKIMTGTVVGVVIVLLAWVAVNTTINVIAGFGIESDPAGQPGGFPWPWNRPDCGSPACYESCLAEGNTPSECMGLPPC